MVPSQPFEVSGYPSLFYIITLMFSASAKKKIVFSILIQDFFNYLLNGQWVFLLNLVATC